MISCCRQRRRPADGSVLHRVGQVMVHKHYGYRGVIHGWTPTCQVGVCVQGRG